LSHARDEKKSRASIITANREEEQFKPSFAGKRTRRTHLKFKICIHAFASATKTPTTFFTRTQSPNKKKIASPLFPLAKVLPNDVSPREKMQQK
jgi:hypothetical protein